MEKQIITLSENVTTYRFEVEKSVFISHSTGVPDSEKAMEFVNRISKQNADATHNCYAFITSDGGRYSDDGEPQGTAGMPIREVIAKSGISNVCIVVTRYFGGVKLGAGGLIRAYSNAASQALSNSPKIILKRCRVVKIKVKYSFSKGAANLIQQYGRQLSVNYETEAEYLVAISIEKAGEFSEKLNEICRGDYETVTIEERMIEL